MDQLSGAILIAGGLMLALFVGIEFEVDHPLLDLRVFRPRATPSR